MVVRTLRSGWTLNEPGRFRGNRLAVSRDPSPVSSITVTQENVSERVTSTQTRTTFVNPISSFSTTQSSSEGRNSVSEETNTPVDNSSSESHSERSSYATPETDNKFSSTGTRTSQRPTSHVTSTSTDASQTSSSQSAARQEPSSTSTNTERTSRLLTRSNAQAASRETNSGFQSQSRQTRQNSQSSSADQGTAHETGHRMISHVSASDSDENSPDNIGGETTLLSTQIVDSTRLVTNTNREAPATSISYKPSPTVFTEFSTTGFSTNSLTQTTSSGDRVITTIVTTIIPLRSAVSTVSIEVTKTGHSGDESGASQRQANTSELSQNKGAIAGIAVVSVCALLALLELLRRLVKSKRRQRRLRTDVRNATHGAGQGGAGSDRFSIDEEDHGSNPFEDGGSHYHSEYSIPEGHGMSTVSSNAPHTHPGAVPTIRLPTGNEFLGQPFGHDLFPTSDNARPAGGFSTTSGLSADTGNSLYVPYSHSGTLGTPTNEGNAVKLPLPTLQRFSNLPSDPRDTGSSRTPSPQQTPPHSDITAQSHLDIIRAAGAQQHFPQIQPGPLLRSVSQQTTNGLFGKRNEKADEVQDDESPIDTLNPGMPLRASLISKTSSEELENEKSFAGHGMAVTTNMRSKSTRQPYTRSSAGFSDVEVATKSAANVASMPSSTMPGSNAPGGNTNKLPTLALPESDLQRQLSDASFYDERPSVEASVRKRKGHTGPNPVKVASALARSSTMSTVQTMSTAGGASIWRGLTNDLTDEAATPLAHDDSILRRASSNMTYHRPTQSYPGPTLVHNGNNSVLPEPGPDSSHVDIPNIPSFYRDSFVSHDSPRNTMRVAPGRDSLQVPSLQATRSSLQVPSPRHLHPVRDSRLLSELLQSRAQASFPRASYASTASYSFHGDERASYISDVTNPFVSTNAPSENQHGST